jgi:hypothetical protein
VSAKRNDISQINKYLQGKLDAKAMHQLERDAQDDPFLMDALDGYEKAGADQQANLIDLDGRLAKRVADEKKSSIFLWRVLPIAASVLIMLGAGYWFFKPKPDKPKYANVTESKTGKKSAPKLGPANTETQKPTVPTAVMALPADTKRGKKMPKSDTANLIATNTNKKPETVEEILKKMKALETAPKGTPLARGKTIVTITTDGKDFPGAAAKTPIFGAKKQVIDTNYTYSGNPYIVTGKEVQDNPVGNVEQLLQGKVAGLNVKNNTGAPGMRGTVNIRGLSTIDSSKWAAIANDASKKHITISGEVKGTYGEALEGATIGAAGKGLTQADKNGKFTVTIPVDINTLVATNIGYKAQVIKIDKQTDLSINLTPDDRSLNEVVIRGYVKRNRDETTGSSYIVTGKDAAKKAANNPPAIAGGKVPGKFLPINPAAQTTPVTNCNENLAFKETFFSNIAIVQKHTEEQVNGSKSTITYKQFFKALTFIARYSPVSINIEKGSTAEYPDLQSFQSEKAQWLEWYEDNRCNNLK